MAKDNLRLISARIDKETYEKITAIADNHLYWKKNYIIRQILLAVLSDFDDGDIYDMLKRPHNPKFPVKCGYHYPFFSVDSKE